MKHLNTLILFLILTLTSCSNKTNGQEVDNTRPMYGEVSKNEEYKKEDNDFKIDCLKQFKTIDSAVNVHIDLGWRYFYKNDLKTAMKRFNQAWLLNSEFPDSYFGFAALMDMQGNKTESERFYKIGFEKDKSKKRAQICYQRIADCKEQLQDFNGTIEAYTKISEINPNNVLAFKKIGYFQMQTRNSEDALAAYGKAIELDPTDATTYNNRAYLYQTRKSYKNAITDYTKAIELDSKYISAYVNKGITEMEINNFNDAKKDFEICVKLDSKSGELRRMLGLAKISLKDKSGACEDFQLAKELGDLQADEIIKQNCK
jgi:tetratricopeptide (TPR) repeat protein